MAKVYTYENDDFFAKVTIGRKIVAEFFEGSKRVEKRTFKSFKQAEREALEFIGKIKFIDDYEIDNLVFQMNGKATES